MKKPKILVIPAFCELHIVPCTRKNIHKHQYYTGCGGIFENHKNGFKSLDDFWEWLQKNFPDFEDSICADWSLLASSKCFVEDDGIFADLRDEWANAYYATAEITPICNDLDGWFYYISFPDGNVQVSTSDEYTEGGVLAAANAEILKQQQRSENDRKKAKHTKFIRRRRNKKGC